MKITLDLEPAEAEAVVTALRNHSSYLKGYAHKSLTAESLERIAAQIERTAKKREKA